MLTQAAGIFQDLQVAQTQSYGPEARGGACRSEIVISDEPIDYIKPVKLDYFLVMSQPAFDKYAPDLDPVKSLVLADSTLVKDGLSNMAKVHTVEATALAEQKLGKPLYANIIMLGALAKVRRYGKPGSPGKMLARQCAAQHPGGQQGGAENRRRRMPGPGIAFRTAWAGHDRRHGL